MYNYYFYIIRPFLLLKLYIKNIILIPEINNLTLSIFIKDVKNNMDQKILNSVTLLEYLCKLIPKIKLFTLYEQKKRMYCGFCFVTLRKYHLYFFFNYFVNFLIRYIKKKNIKLLNNKLNMKNIYSFNIKDLSIFYFLPFFFYDWEVNVKFTFLFKNNLKFGYKFLLNSFNFPF